MNPILTQIPESDPALLLRFRDRQYSAELIATALLHLDLFSWLDAHPGAEPDEVTQHFNLSPRPLDVLLTLCRATGLLKGDCTAALHLTPLAQQYFVRGSAWYLGPYYKPIQDNPIVQGYLRVLHSGQPAQWQAKKDGKDWHQSMLDPDFAQDFTQLMNCRGLLFGQHLARALAPTLKECRHILDVGGGSGIYSATLVAAHPHLHATVLEQPPVDAIVKSEFEKHGVTDRASVVSGDMFKLNWPQADAVLFSNVLHDWDVPEVRILLQRAAQCLPKGGQIIIHDAFISDDKTGPLPVAEYSALLMNITQGKCYSAAEYAALLIEAGFTPGTYHPTVADRGWMSAIKN